MVENGFIKTADAEKANKEPLDVRRSRAPARTSFAAEYFAEEVRRELYERYGEKKLYEGGLSVRTTLDPKMQVHGAQGADRRAGEVRRGAWLARRGQQDRHLRRLGRQARRGQGAQRYLAVAARGGARNQRSVGAHRPAAGPRSGRRCRQGPRHRHPSARRREVGEGRRRPDARQGADQGRAGARAGRRHLCRAAADKDGSRRRSIPAAPGAGSLRRDGRDGSRGPAACSRWSAASPTTRASSTARRRRCASPARRSSRSSTRRRSTMAIRRRRVVLDAPIEIDQGPGPASGGRKTIRKQFLRPVDAALRHRAFAQRHDGAAGAGCRHAADRRICQALRRL